MKTPIIDSLWEKTKGIREYHAALEEAAKKLEADRAELLEALELACAYPTTGNWWTKADATLTKVKANFPTTGN